MFPRNPENGARRLPRPARGAAPPQGPAGAEPSCRAGVCVCACTFTCAACMQVHASTG